MSFLIGPISGTLVAGGVYYGFSNLIRTRTEQHRNDLHVLSVRLVETPGLIVAPPSAASRIQQSTFATFIHERWNQDIENVFKYVRQSDQQVLDWGRKLLYGGGNPAAGASVVPTKSEQS